MSLANSGFIKTICSALIPTLNLHIQTLNTNKIPLAIEVQTNVFIRLLFP